jgi:hypothetical protein
MNQQLERVLEQVRALHDGHQREVAELVLAFLGEPDPDPHLSPKLIASIERRVAEDGPYAADEEVRALFARLTQ